MEPMALNWDSQIKVLNRLSEPVIRKQNHVSRGGSFRFSKREYSKTLSPKASALITAALQFSFNHPQRPLKFQKERGSENILKELCSCRQFAS